MPEQENKTSELDEIDKEINTGLNEMGSINDVERQSAEVQRSEEEGKELSRALSDIKFKLETQEINKKYSQAALKAIKHLLSQRILPRDIKVEDIPDFLEDYLEDLDEE